MKDKVTNQTVKHNTLNTKPTKIMRDKDNAKSPWMEQYKDCFTFQFKPVTEAFIQRISQELVIWAKTDNGALRIADFYWNKGIPHQTFYTWVNKHEDLKLAHEAALNFIASRREKGALNKELSESMVIRRQHAYDQEWFKDKDQEKQDRIDVAIAVKAAIDGSNEKNVTVVMSCYTHPEGSKGSCNETANIVDLA